MTNNGQFDPVASWAKLSERVENQGKDIVDLRSNMNSGFQSINSNLAALSNELRATGKTPWPVIWSALGVSVAIIVAIGGLAYAPITAGMGRVETSIDNLGGRLDTLAERTITRQEMDWRQARSQEDRLRMESSIVDLRSNQIPRAEHERVWQNYDQQMQDKQRQIDEIKAAQNSVYGARDAMMDMRDRLDRLEQQRRASPP